MKLRNLAPWRSFDIDTSWSPEVATTELKKSIDAGSLFFGGGGSAPFIGEMRDNAELLFRRRISYRNAFLPIVRVIVGPSHRGGARLRVTMRLHYFVGVFTAVWMTVALGGVSAAFSGAAAGRPPALFGLAFPLFGIGLVVIPFAVEASKAERLLRSIYASAPAMPPPPETGQAYR